MQATKIVAGVVQATPLGIEICTPSPSAAGLKVSAPLLLSGCRQLRSERAATVGWWTPGHPRSAHVGLLHLLVGALERVTEQVQQAYYTS